MVIRRHSAESVNAKSLIKESSNAQPSLPFPKAVVHKTVKQSLKELLLSTEIHGIGDVFSPDKHCVERFLWIIIIVGSVSICLHDGIVFFERYRAEPTQTFTYVVYNRSISIDKATFCVRIREKAYMPSVSITSPFAVRNYLYGLANFSSDDLLETLSDPKFNDLLILTSIMVQDIVRMEQRSIDHIASEDLELMAHSQKWSAVEVRKINDAPSSPAVHQFYTKHGIDIASLPALVGAAVCRRLGVEVRNNLKAVEARPAESTRIDVCKPEKVSWFGRMPPEVDAVPIDHVCFHIRNERIVFESLADYLYIKLNYLNLFEPVMAFKWSKCIGTLDLNGRLMPVDLGANIFQMWQGQSKNYNVELEGEYKMLNLKRRPCRSRGDRLECRSILRAKARLEACGCYPLSWFAYYRHTNPVITGPICGQPAIDPNEESDNNATSFFRRLRDSWNTTCTSTTRVVLHDDEGDCYDPCDTKIFGSQGAGVFEAPDDNMSTSGGYSDMFVRMHDFNYPVYEEALVYSDWRFFISSLGGIIGFWLGASILAMVSLIMAVVRLILRAIHDDGAKRKPNWNDSMKPESKLAKADGQTLKLEPVDSFSSTTTNQSIIDIIGANRLSYFGRNTSAAKLAP